ncbi:MAG: Ig-like domain-containing protein, partial [Planctomycetota bacterium]
MSSRRGMRRRSFSGQANRRNEKRRASRYAHIELLEERLQLSAASLDPTFDDDGLFRRPITNGDVLTDLAIQPDSDIVAVGPSLGSDSTKDFRVFRFTSNGSLDPSFGTGGAGAVDFGGIATAGSVALQHSFGEFNIIAAGTVTDPDTGRVKLAIASITEDGSLNTSFSSDGKVTIDFGADFEGPFHTFYTIGATDDEFLGPYTEEMGGASLAVQPDGTIWVAGTVAGDVALARLTPDGRLDTDFGPDGNGRVVLSISEGDVLVSDVALSQSANGDVQLVVVGTALRTTRDMFVARFADDGTLDTSFGTIGYVIDDARGDRDDGEAVAIQQDGRIVVAGSSVDSTNSDMAVWRFNTNGTRDSTFTPDGRVFAALGGEDTAHDVAIQVDGRIVVVGASPETGDFDTAIVRLNPNGTQDSTFSSDGEHTEGLGDDDRALAVTIQPDGRILLAGHRNPFGGPELFASDEPTLLRYDGRARIHWTNRGTGPDNDTDRFNEVFGNDADTMRAIVDAGIASWENVIHDFKNDTGVINVTISMAAEDDSDEDRKAGHAAVARNISIGSDGRPLSGEIVIGRGRDTRGDDEIGDGETWIRDPDPSGFSYFTGEILNPFVGRTPASRLMDTESTDMYRKVVHELLHVIGLTNESDALFTRNRQNTDTSNDTDELTVYESVTGDEFTITNTGVADQRFPAGEYWVFQGTSVDAVFTSNNGGNEDRGLPLHLAARLDSGGNPVTVNFSGETFRPVDDTYAYGARRYTKYPISNLDALLLKDIYDYDIVMPETFGTFHAILHAPYPTEFGVSGSSDTDRVPGHLLIRGVASSSNETITIERDGTELVVGVDFAADVPGIGPTDAFLSRFPISEVSEITIVTNGGTDTVVIDSSGGDVAIPHDLITDKSRFVIIGGSGDDTVRLVGDQTISEIEFRGSGGDDTLELTGNGRYLNVDFDGEAGDDVLEISGSPAALHYNVDDVETKNVRLENGTVPAGLPGGLSLTSGFVLSGTGTVASPVVVDSGGRIQLDAGSIEFTDEVTINPGGLTRLSNRTFTGTSLHLAGGNLEGHGTVSASIEGTAGSTIEVDEGVLELGTLANYGGNLLISPEATARIDGDLTVGVGQGVQLTNGVLEVGTLTVSGGDVIGHGIVITSNDASITPISPGTVDVSIPLDIGDRNATVYSDGVAGLGVSTVLGGGQINSIDTAGVVVGTGDRFEGHGVVNTALTVTGGTLSPGHLMTGDINLDASSTLELSIDGFEAGVDHDLLAVTGTVTIDAATLDLSISLNDESLRPGQTFLLIDNDGDDAIVGTFAGLSQGTRISVSELTGDDSRSEDLVVRYDAGDGNDFAVSVIDEQITEPVIVGHLRNYQSDYFRVAADAHGNSVVMWEDGIDFNYRLFNRAGEPVTEAIQFDTPYDYSGNIFDLRIGMADDGRFAIVWRSNASGIFVQRFDATGVPVGMPVAVHTEADVGRTSSNDILMNKDGSFVVAWDAGAQGNGLSEVILARRFDANGMALDADPIVVSTLPVAGTSSNYVTDATLIGDGSGYFTAVWKSVDNLVDDVNDTHVLLFRRFTADGSAVDVQERAVMSGRILAPLVADMNSNRRFTIAAGDNGEFGDSFRHFSQGGNALTDRLPFDHVEGLIAAAGGSGTGQPTGVIQTDQGGAVYGLRRRFSFPASVALLTADGELRDPRVFRAAVAEGTAQSARLAGAGDNSIVAAWDVDHFGTDDLVLRRIGELPDVVVNEVLMIPDESVRVSWTNVFNLPHLLELGFYRSADLSWDPSDELLLSRSDFAAANGTHELILEIGDGDGQIPAGSLGGDYLIVVADPSDDIFETDAHPYQEDNLLVAVPTDFGDAPDVEYGTLAASTGARHGIAGPRLGDTVTAEYDGQPTTAADGDSGDDGVTIPGPLSAGATVELIVSSSSGGGVLDYFFDFDQSGVFGDQPNEVFRTVLDGGGGTTYARFRISSAGVDSPIGMAPDGEVEDYVVRVVTPGGDFRESFDTVTAPNLPDEWSAVSGDGNFWSVIGDAESHSSPNHAFVANLSSQSDSSLVSPVVVVRSSAAQISFQNHYDTESGFDGGKMEVSIDGAGFVDIVEAGGSFVSGGYNRTVAAAGGSDGWSGNSSGYVQTVVSLPADFAGHGVQFRWRMQSDSSVRRTGWRIDDVLITGVAGQNDFGDAPDSYQTLLASNGAWHVITEMGPVLGQSVDAEADGAPGAAATGDDTAGENDDDGIQFTDSLVQGAQVSVDVTVSQAGGFLNAWIDFDRNGTWDSGEQIADDVAVSTGTQSVVFSIPADAEPGQTYARFRVSSASGLGATGYAEDGEVEDYAVSLVEADMTSPTVTVDIVDASLSDSDATSVVTFEFDEDVTGFDATDVSASGGTLSGFMAFDGDSYSATFTADNDSVTDGSVSIGTDYSDLAGNAGTTGSDTVSIDTRNPSLTITPAGTMTSQSPILFTFQFSETVRDFESGDVSLTNGSAGTLTAVDGDTFTLEVTPTADGTVMVSADTGAAQDTAGNDSGASSAAVTFAAIPDPVPADVTLPGAGAYEVLRDGTDLVVRVEGGAELLRDAASLISVLRITGSVEDDQVTVLDTGTVVDTRLVFSGGNGNDRFDASLTAGAVNLTGNGGNDALLGGPLSDTLNGGSGKDELVGGLGDDSLNGGGSTGDTLEAGAGDDTLNGGSGNDVIRERVSGHVTLTNTSMTGLGNDVVISVERAILTGSGAAQMIDVSAFLAVGTSTTLVGGGGNDTLLGTAGADVLLGAGGSDEIDGGSGNDRIFGGSGSDTLIGGAGNDLLKGLGGTGDQLSGGDGDDTLNGGRGVDRLFESADVDFTLTNMSLTGLGDDVVQALEIAQLTGGASGNVIDVSAFSGFRGFTQLRGKGGDDSIVGSSMA